MKKPPPLELTTPKPQQMPTARKLEMSKTMPKLVHFRLLGQRCPLQWARNK
jgi:hypothetical protein